MSCYGEANVFVSYGNSNITIEGCAFTGTYPGPSAAYFCGEPGPNAGGGPAVFYNGSNLTFTDNAVTNMFAGQGLEFDGASNVTVSKDCVAGELTLTTRTGEKGSARNGHGSS
jgi:hypothetical protein